RPRSAATPAHASSALSLHAALPILVNLSAAGMLVELGFPLAPGTELDFSFLLPGEDSPVAGSGQIVRRATPSRYGVRFDGLEDDASERLRRFVARREEKA